VLCCNRLLAHSLKCILPSDAGLPNRSTATPSSSFDSDPNRRLQGSDTRPYFDYSYPITVHVLENSTPSLGQLSTAGRVSTLVKWQQQGESGQTAGHSLARDSRWVAASRPAVADLENDRARRLPLLALPWVKLTPLALPWVKLTPGDCSASCTCTSSLHCPSACANANQACCHHRFARWPQGMPGGP
jgi:hypothetical protein